jgi:hypothetical protein
MNHRRKSSLNILICKITSRTKTLSKVKTFMLNNVDIIPLIAAETLVEAGISTASMPILYRNQPDIL